MKHQKIGLVNLMNAEDRLKAVDQALDEYEKLSGIPPATAPGEENELNQYFTMDRKSIESLSPEDSMEICFRLAQFAIYIQRLQNREKSRAYWAENILKEIIGTESTNYNQYTKYENMVGIIIKDNEFANKINKIIVYAKQRIARLDYLSNNIKFMSEILMRFNK